MEKMKKIGIMTVLVSLLLIAITPMDITPLIKSNAEAKFNPEKEIATELVELTIFACQGDRYEKTTIKIPLKEANEIRASFNNIHKMNLLPEEKLNLQLALFKEKGIIPEDITIEDLEQISHEKFKGLDTKRFSEKFSAINNNDIIFDTFCILEFSLIGFGLVLRMDFLEGILSKILNVTAEEDLNTYLAGVFLGLYGEAGTLSPKGEPQYQEYDNYLAGFFVGLVGYVVTQLGCIFYGPFVAGIGITALTGWGPLYSF